MVDNSRYHDILELEKDLKKEVNPVLRNNLKRSLSLINQETGSIKSMREKLIKAHREGNMNEVKDIHDYIRNKSKYKNQ